VTAAPVTSPAAGTNGGGDGMGAAVAVAAVGSGGGGSGGGPTTEAGLVAPGEYQLAAKVSQLAEALEVQRAAFAAERAVVAAKHAAALAQYKGLAAASTPARSGGGARAAPGGRGPPQRELGWHRAAKHQGEGALSVCSK